MSEHCIFCAIVARSAPARIVAEDDRALALPVPVANVEIGMADAGRRHPNADLARTGRIELEIFDPDGNAGTVDHGGADRRNGERFSHRRRIARRDCSVAA